MFTRMVIVCGLLVSALVGVLATPGRAGATNHDLHIREVMVGANGDSNVQFIVIEQHACGQNAWSHQFGDPANESRALLLFFDATGRESGRFKFRADPRSPCIGAIPTLIATAEFAQLPGAPTPDVIIPPLLNPIGGMVCFKNNPADTVFVRNECVTYGNFTGTTPNNCGDDFCNPAVSVGAPAAPGGLPITDTKSISRSVNTNTNASFSLSSTPTPRNTFNATFTIPVAAQIHQGETLFNNEAFFGNGRTCGTCHVASENFRLPPRDVQSRFSTLASTFDPLFIAEAKPSSFDAGFDFNLNTLVVSGAVPANPSAGCTGELRGVITTSNGGRGLVVTRVNPTTYLVYGGRNPMLTGVVTDTVCSATVMSLTDGGLGALENPARMRTSGSPDLPQGRGLILENIDGFANPPVFRKSPHLLNLSRTAPFGFSGDIPDLQTFATGAVIQHFPRTLTRTAGGASPDFRLPTAAELASIEAFMLDQEFPPGNDPNKFDLDRFAVTPAQVSGRTAFFGSAKCSQCHGGSVLAQTTVSILGKPIGVNASFNTGVVNQPINSPAGDNLPCEPSVGTCGSREFSVPQLFNVRNLGPFFHDASAATLRQAVEFYSSAAFNNSPAGLAIGGITLSAQTTDDLVAFLEGLTPKVRDREFNRDGRTDILWRHSSGIVAMWLMNGSTIASNLGIATIPTDWSIVGSGDFNGDAKADILWRNTTTGVVAMWLMNGAAIVTNLGIATIPTSWVVAGVGDFNGDGKADILWRNTTTGQVAMWLMNGATIVTNLAIATIPTNWVVAGVGDFNGDGKSDILWRNTTTGQVALWLMNGATIVTNLAIATIPTNWVIAGVGDFNGDGKADILWRNTTTGVVAMWLMNGPTIVSNLGIATIPTEWVIVQAGDFNGDGKSDILWRNTTTGVVAMWLMDGATIVTNLGVVTVPTSWTVQ